MGGQVTTRRATAYFTCIRKLVIAIRGRSEGEWHTSSHFQKLELRGIKTSSLTSVGKDNMIMEIYEATNPT